MREVERLRERERERGGGKKLPSACDQPAANDVRTGGGVATPSAGMSPAHAWPDPIFVSPCNLVQALEFSLMTYL